MVALGALPGRVVAVAPGPVGLLVRALAVVASAAAVAAVVEVVLPAVHEAVRVLGGRFALLPPSLPKCVALVCVPSVVPAFRGAFAAVLASAFLGTLAFGVAVPSFLAGPVSFLSVPPSFLAVPVTLLSVPVPLLAPSGLEAGESGSLAE